MSSPEEQPLLDAICGPGLDQPPYYYDVKEKEFVQWLQAAKTFQNRYARDNGETDYLTYTHDQRGKLIEQIRLRVFGFRPVNYGYSKEETEGACKIKQKIVEVSGGNEATVYINVSYLSTFTYLEGKFQATEIPVFVVKSGDGILFVDTKCTVFKNISIALKAIGERFKGGIMYATNFCHKAARETGQVTLLYTESTASSIANRAVEVVETALTYASIVLGVTSVAVSLPLGPYLRAATSFVRGQLLFAGVASTTLALTKASIDLGRCYKEGRFEDAGGKVIFLFAMAFSSASQRLTSKLTATTTLQDVNTKYGGWFKKIFYTLRTATTISTFMSITQSLYARYKKKQWEFGDLYHMSMSFFSLYNISISPWTIEAILESEQMKMIESMESELNTNEARTQFNDILGENKDLDDRAIVLRNLVEISDRQNFLHQTYKIRRDQTNNSESAPTQDAESLPTIQEEGTDEQATQQQESNATQPRSAPANSANDPRSGIRFKADGMNISGSLDISPKTWNTVGDETLRSSIASLVGKPNRLELIHKQLQKVNPDAYVKGVIEGVPEEQMEAKLRSAIQERKTDLAIATEGGADAAVLEQKQRTIDNLELHAAAAASATDGGTALSQQITKHAHYRKEDLLKATVTARDFSDKLSSLEEARNSLLEPGRMDLMHEQLHQSHPDEYVKKLMAGVPKGEMESALRKAINERKADLATAAKNGADPSVLEEKQSTIDILNKHAAAEALPKDMSAVIDRMHDRARDPTKTSAATATQYRNVRAAHGTLLEEAESAASTFHATGNSFANAQNERFNFKHNEMRVDKLLANAFGTDNSFEVGGNAIFANMRPNQYDRLRRVFDEVKPGHIQDSLEVCRDPRMAEFVKTADDFACVTELVKMGDSADTIIQKIGEIQNVDPAHPWTSILSKTYHYYKHESEFRTDPAVATNKHGFFNKHAESIFRNENQFQGNLFTQFGIPRQAFYKALGGGRVHTGFKAGGRVSTHFAPR